MGRYFETLPAGNCQVFYACSVCSLLLVNEEKLISTNFRGASGPAYLFTDVVNVFKFKPLGRHLITGHHVTSTIACGRCKHKVGWFYDFAYESTQEYKEGKFILEVNLVKSVIKPRIVLPEQDVPTKYEEA